MLHRKLCYKPCSSLLIVYDSDGLRQRRPGGPHDQNDAISLLSVIKMQTGSSLAELRGVPKATQVNYPRLLTWTGYELKALAKPNSGCT